MMRTVIAAVSLLVVACGGSPTGPTNSAATLNVRITDTPFEDAKAVLVTFSGVSVHLANDEGWTTIPFVEGTSRTCDLKKLEVETDLLVVAMLEEGHYTQIRLTTASAELYFDPVIDHDTCAPEIDLGVESTPLEISSGQVILNRPFDLTDDTTITLDFDGNRSIREAPPGSFRMTPVISVVSVQ